MQIFTLQWTIKCLYSLISHENVDLSLLLTSLHKVSGMNVKVYQLAEALYKFLTWFYMLNYQAVS